MIFFEKFPEIIWKNKKVIWDTRQIPVTSSDAELKEFIVIIPQDATELVSLSLKALRSFETHDEKNEHGLLGKISADHFGHPGNQLKIIGVTGTNGKTSTVNQIAYGASAQKNSGTALSIGTLGLCVWQKGQLIETIETGYTTPLAPQVHHIFSQCIKGGINLVAMEVSSHALVLGRMSEVFCDVGVFLNLSQDHLDFHGDMTQYAEAKYLLFSKHLKESGLAVFNTGDSTGSEFAEKTKTRKELFQLGKNFSILESSLKGLKIKINETDFTSQCVGNFQAENLVAAHLSLEEILGSEYSPQVFNNFSGVRGRLEKVIHSNTKTVFVDYAHTPDALEKSLSTLNSAKPNNSKIWCVFGCGGDRDKTKRPLMGKIAAHNADFVILTSDNPRTENPDQIIEDIYSGIPTQFLQKITKFEERELAIQTAISEMKETDVLLIAGKGHETYQVVGTQKKHFSDYECAEKNLKLK